MTTIYQELTEATGLAPRANEDAAAFFKRLALAVDKLAEDDWKELSEEAQVWTNDAITAVDKKDAMPDLPGMPEADDEPDGDAAGDEEPDEVEKGADEVEPEEPAPKTAKGKKAKAASAPKTAKTTGGAKVNGADTAPASVQAKKGSKKAAAKTAAKGTKFAAKVGAEAKTKTAASAKAPATASKTKTLGKRAAVAAAAREGKMPPVPDFSADTHKPWRKKLAEVVALAKAGNVKGLEKYLIKPYSTSSKAIDRYRNLAVVALKARR